MLRKNYKVLIIGIIIGLIFSNVLVFAESTTASITAVYRNIRLIVDGIQIEPKDANGVVIEPFISNGTTYLPVRSVGQAFGKEVFWDGDTNTVYIGGVIPKPAKEITLYDKSYIENTNPRGFNSYKTGDNYLAFYFHVDKSDSESVTYPVNGMAKAIKGTLIAPESSGCEFICKIYDESDKCLYTSPIMTKSTQPYNFEADISNCVAVRIEFIINANFGSYTVKIENPVIVTTEY